MNAKINTQSTSIRIANSKADISFHRPIYIKSNVTIKEDGVFAWLDFSSEKDEVTIHLTEGNLHQLKEAIEHIEKFYAKEAV